MLAIEQAADIGEVTLPPEAVVVEVDYCRCHRHRGAARWRDGDAERVADRDRVWVG